MQGYNLIMVCSPDRSKILFCERVKEPYLGLFNLPGGKIEPGEDGLAAAYRELFEETGITAEDITLLPLMDFKYHNQGCYVEVYAGRLKRDVAVRGEENPLFWSGLDKDFFDPEKYAGEGNIGHMIMQLKLFGEGYLEWKGEYDMDESTNQPGYTNTHKSAVVNGARILQVASKCIFLDESGVIYDKPFTADSLSRDFEPASGEWSVENGWVTGHMRKNSGGLLYSRESFPGDIVIEFDAHTVPPCENDINFTWKSQGWDFGTDNVGRGYIGGLGGWWVNKAGIEKFPGCVPYAASALSPIRAGELYHVAAGSVGNICFLFVNGALVLEMLDPEPETLKDCGKFGLGTYASRVSFTNLRAYSPLVRDFSMSYAERD